jgi:hypothetical protein
MVMPRAPMLPATKIIALGHGVARPVGGVARTMIWAPALSQPTSSETGPTTSIDRVGDAHGPDPLAEVPRIRTVTVSLPARQSRPPDAVLALGDDLDLSMPVGHGLLEPLLEDPRLHAVPLLRSGDDDARLLAIPSPYIFATPKKRRFCEAASIPFIPIPVAVREADSVSANRRFSRGTRKPALSDRKGNV